MKSKTSFCNRTVLGKDLTRFAPLWILYTLCLLLGMALLYVDNDNKFWFANNVGEMIHNHAVINLIYAPLVAMLLFGDLYNPRMCNALHAMPLKRGCWFGSHVIAGLLFSVIPTAIFCGAAVPVLMNTCVVGGGWIALYAFLGMNLSYLCFFGMAVFSVFCAGNRFGMAAVYALLNGGAYIVYFLIDSIYTPLLYGVITPTQLAENLTPVNKLLQSVCLELDAWGKLTQLYGPDVSKIQAHFWLLPEGWLSLGLWALVGVGFMALGRVLYGKRKLECAGDIMAFKALEPVFLICIAVCAAAFGSLFLSIFFGYRMRSMQYLFLVCGLVAGWFAGKMFIERTVRVFRLKNWLGLVALAAVFGVTIGLAHYDVFGIESWLPNPEEVHSVTFGYSTYRGMSEELTDEADIRQVIRLQALALEDRLAEPETYVEMDGRRYYPEEAKALDLLEQANIRYASTLMIHYTMDNGRLIQRQYNIWADGEEGAIVNEYLSRWEVVSNAGYYNELTLPAPTQEAADKDPYYSFTINGNPVPGEFCTQGDIDSLVAAIKADCEERTMTQRAAFHTGHFEFTYEDGTPGISRSFWLEFGAENFSSGSFNVFPDSENTLNWLRQRNLLTYTVHPENAFNG